jgi:hypothetical protein
VIFELPDGLFPVFDSSTGQVELLPLPEDLPAACHPQVPRVGKASYTVKSVLAGIVTAAVEVHLNNRKFYIKFGMVGPNKISPSVAWAKTGGVQPAWDRVVELVGGWHPPCADE